MKCVTCGHDGGRHIEYERVYPEPCGVKGCDCKNFVAPKRKGYDLATPLTPRGLRP